jgi:chemosensory pili system protein ChpB (putative protein-glutamate methylesterase)
MNAPAAPSVGVVATGDLLRHALKSLLLESGYDARLVAPQQLRTYLQREGAGPDAWLLDANAAEVEELLDRIIHHSDAPVLISDEPPPPRQSAAYTLWRRRMLDKLEELVASAGAQPLAAARPPLAVWVLAASPGGPEAVGRFLAALAPGLPIALVYAQHIDAHFDQVLAAALERHKHYGINLCRGQQQLAAGQILVVPADRQLRFLPFHRVLELRKTWDGPYQPVIDQVVAQLARLYQSRCGTIVFSGLCDDGAVGCRVLQACGGEVWVQSPDCCLSPDMPQAALATGAVTRQGTPEQLAQALSSRYAA